MSWQDARAMDLQGTLAASGAVAIPPTSTRCQAAQDHPAEFTEHRRCARRATQRVGFFDLCDECAAILAANDRPLERCSDSFWEAIDPNGKAYPA